MVTGKKCFTLDLNVWTEWESNDVGYLIMKEFLSGGGTIWQTDWGAISSGGGGGGG